MRLFQWLSIPLAIIVLDPARAADVGRSPTGQIPELTALHQTEQGSTGVTSFVSTLSSAACSKFSAVPGPDVVYTWVAQVGNPYDPGFPLHLDFFVRPQAGFDAVVYALSELDNGASCIAAVDWAGPGEQEMLHTEEQLIPGQRYYLYIDSRTQGHRGNYSLVVSTFIPVELQSFTIE